MQTMEQFLPEAEREGIKVLDSYQTMQRDFEYLEGFVDHEGVPNIVELVSQLISSQIGHVSNPELRPVQNRISNSYKFSTSGLENSTTDNVTIDFGLFGVGVKSKLSGEDYGEPSIQIHRFGHNRSGGLKNAKRGVHLQGYNIPRDVADIVLREFTKLEGDRNDIILELARSEDLTGCYSKDYWVNHQKQYIEKGETPQSGIDENTAFVIERDLGNVCVYGHACGVHNGKSNVSLDIRIEVDGERFQFPSERQPGFDITEEPYQ